MLSECPFCKQGLEAPDEIEGQEVKCPSCNEDFILVSGTASLAHFGSESMTRCMFCGKDVHKSETTCPKCGNIINKKKFNSVSGESRNPNPVMTLGLAIIAIPVFAIGGLLLQPVIFHRTIIIAVIISTATLAATEAHNNADVDIAKRKQNYIAFFIGILLLWMVGYPYYLFYRKNYGLKNLGVIGILLTVLFITAIYLPSTVNSEKTDTGAKPVQFTSQVKRTDTIKQSVKVKGEVFYKVKQGEYIITGFTESDKKLVGKWVLISGVKHSLSEGDVYECFAFDAGTEVLKGKKEDWTILKYVVDRSKTDNVERSQVK